jgi:hypothetical protein
LKRRVMMASEDTRVSTPQITSETDAPQAPRRSFMKGTFAAATAVAAGGIASTAGDANAQEGKAAAKLSSTVHAHFDSRNPPKLADLQKVVAQIVSRSGCPTCGLLGVDLRLTAGDPLPVEVGVPVSVSVTRGVE